MISQLVALKSYYKGIISAPVYFMNKYFVLRIYYYEKWEFFHFEKALWGGTDKANYFLTELSDKKNFNNNSLNFKRCDFIRLYPNWCFLAGLWCNIAYIIGSSPSPAPWPIVRQCWGPEVVSGAKKGLNIFQPALFFTLDRWMAVATIYA